MKLLFLIVVYLLLRLVNLTLIPIFTDEAMYLRWAQIGLLEPSKYLFISLIDGKQPLFIWLTYPFMLILNDPLVAGRIVSVICGAFTLVLLYFLSLEIFNNKKITLLSSLLYLASPFAAIYDRLALMDCLLGTLFLASIFCQIKLAKTLKIKFAVFTGLSMGLGLLTKSSADFFLLLSPLSFIFLNQKSKSNIVKWLKLLALSGIIALLISLILFLSPLRGMINLKNSVFVLSPNEFLQNPLRLFSGNLLGLISFINVYQGTIFLLIIIVAILTAVFKKNTMVLFLFTLFFVPFIFLAAFGKIIYPRFIFFMILPLFIIEAHFVLLIFSVLKTKLARLMLIVLVFVYPVTNTYLILTKPTAASIPKADADQLLNSWPSGYGVKEVVAYIEKESKTKKIFLATEGTQGLFPYALELYLYRNKNVTIKGYWPVKDIPAEVREKAKTVDTYFIYKDTLNPAPQSNTKIIFKVRRGIGNNYLKLLQVLPE